MAQKLKIGVVTARFNHEITYLLEQGALDILDEADVDVISVRVPGAVEIPLTCKVLLDNGCDGVVALGAVIRGDTAHFDYVCQSVERGVTTLMLETNKPIGFGVITTENEEQAQSRAGGEHGNKGAEAAQVVLEMIGVLEAIRQELPGGFKEAAKKSVKTSKAKKVSKKR